MLQRIATFGIGIGCGLVVGTAFALIITPNSGVGLRQQLREHVQNALAEGAQAAEARRADLQQDLKARTTPPTR